MYKLLRIVILLAVAVLPIGCTHTPRAIALPTTAAVRAPLVQAQASVARAVAAGQREQQLAARAVAKGLAAGSAEAHELSSLTLAHAQADTAAQDQLSAALYHAGELDREQKRKQAEIDALAKDDAAKTRLVVVLERSLLEWRTALLILVGADFFIGGLIQNALRAAVAFVFRVGAAFIKHLIAFWPVLLALL